MFRFPWVEENFEIDFKKSISRCLLSLTSFAPGRGHQPSPLLFSLLPQTLSFPCFIPKLGPDHILFNSLFLWQLYNEMIISVSMGLHSLQIFFPRLEQKHIDISFLNTLSNFSGESKLCHKSISSEDKTACFGRNMKTSRNMNLIVFLVSLLPTQKLSVQSLFLLFAKKINHILLKIGKKSTKHVTGDFPDNLKRWAYSRNCCLSFRHRRNPSYLNLCLPSESVNSKLRLIVKQACC